MLRERLHALRVGDLGELGTLRADRPPVKASAFAAGAAVPPQPLSGYAPLARKVHTTDPAVAAALGDWLHGVYAIEQMPAAGERLELPAGGVLVVPSGDQCTRNTISFHAPDPADAGILERQTEIDTLQERCTILAARSAAARADAERVESEAVSRQAALEEARSAIAALQADKHAAEIDRLKRAQALERYRERTAQIRAEMAEITLEIER